MGSCSVQSPITPLRFFQIPRSILLFNHPKVSLAPNSCRQSQPSIGLQHGFCKRTSLCTKAVLSEISNQKQYPKVAAESTGPIPSIQLLKVVEIAAKTGAEVCPISVYLSIYVCVYEHLYMHSSIKRG